MGTLDQQAYEQIIALLKPLMTTEQDRRAQLLHAFYGHTLVDRVDYTGPTAIFIARLVEQLSGFGKLDDGRPALWALLEISREQVGLDQKHRIDALRPIFDLPPAPRLDRLFVSYSRKNERFARRLVGDLKDAGLKVWYDREKIRVGEDWWQSIVRGIEAADFFVFCLSPDSIRSEVACDELMEARKLGKPIFPVELVPAIGDLKTTGFERVSWLSDWHIMDFKQPDDYGQRLRELIESLPGYTPPDPYYLNDIDPKDLPNPFRGLEAFYEVDSAYYAGREDTVMQLLTRVQDASKPRLLAIVGASGSGKSSLVRAGLVPAIRQQLPFWEPLIIRPGTDPLDVLADSLQERLGSTDRNLRVRLRRQPHALDDIASELMQGTRDGARLVLVVDQFEELFTIAYAYQRDLMLQHLLDAVQKPTGRVYVILTLRADFFDRLSGVPELARLVSENLDIATEMTPDQLRRSIQVPAQKVGVHYEDGLVETILEDVRDQPGSLPLLQYALKELFKRKLGRRITREAYTQINGIKGALATRAESIYNDLTPQQQEALRRILLRLVAVGDESVTRRRTPASDLRFHNIPKQRVEDILTTLTEPDARLLVASAPLIGVADGTTANVYYEVSHEALLTHWQRVANWIQENRNDLRFGSDVLALANTWNQTDRKDASYLLRGARLSFAREWLGRADPTRLQRQFVEASVEYDEAEKQRERDLQQRALNRARTLATSFAIFLVIAVGLTLLVFERQTIAESNAATATQALGVSQQRGTEVAIQRNSANARGTEVAIQRDSANAQRLMAEAQALAQQTNSNPETIALLNLAAYRLEPSERAIDQLRAISGRLRTTFSKRVDGLALPPFNDTNSEAFVPGPISPVQQRHGHAEWLVAGVDGRVTLVDMQSASVLTAHQAHQGASITSMSSNRDEVASLDDDGRLALWRPETESLNVQQLDTLTLGEDPLVALSDDYLVIANRGLRMFDRTENSWRMLLPYDESRSILSMAVQPESNKVAVITIGTGAVLSGSPPSLIVWNLPQIEPILTLELDLANIAQNVSISPDGRWIALGSLTQIHLVDSFNGSFQTFGEAGAEGGIGATYNIGFDMGSTQMIATRTDAVELTTTGRIWDLASGELLTILRGPHDILRTSFLDSTNTAATLQSDGTIRHWRLSETTNDEIALSDGQHITSPGFETRNFAQVLPGDNIMLVVGFDTTSDRNPQQEWGIAMVSLPTGNLLAQASLGNAVIATSVDDRVVYINNSEHVHRLNPISGGADALFSISDGQPVIGADLVGERLLIWRALLDEDNDPIEPFTYEIYALSDAEVIWHGTTEGYHVHEAEILHASGQLVLNPRRGRLQLIDVHDGSEAEVNVGNNCEALVNITEPYVYLHGSNSTLCVWDSVTEEVVHRFDGRGSIRLSNDGWINVVSASGRNVTIRRWHPIFGAETRRVQLAKNIQLGYLAGYYVSVTDNETHIIIELSSGDILYELPLGEIAQRGSPEWTGGVPGQAILWEPIAPAPLNTLVAIREMSPVVRLWDMATGTLTREITAMRVAGEANGGANVFSGVVATFSPEGRYVLTLGISLSLSDAIGLLGSIGNDNQSFPPELSTIIEVWPLDYVGLFCSALARDLTPGERNRYNISASLQACPASVQGAASFASAMRAGQQSAANADYRSAVDAFTQALALEPGNTQAAYERGNANLALHHYEAAIADYETVRDAEAANAGAHLSLGQAYAAIGEYQSAISAYANALRFVEDTGSAAIEIRDIAREGLVLAYRERAHDHWLAARYSQALASVQEGLALQPDDPHSRFVRGRIYRSLERYDDALADLDWVIARVDEAEAQRIAGLYDERGRVLAELGRTEDALSAFNTAIEYDPFYIDTYFQRAGVLEKLERYDNAIVDLTQVIEGRPNRVNSFPALLERYGNYLQLEQNDAALLDLDTAIALFSQVEATYPDAVDASFLATLHAGRGLILQGMERREDALAAYDQALEIDPQNSTALSGLNTLFMDADLTVALANLRFEVGDYRGAVEHYTEAIAAYEALNAPERMPIPYHERGKAYIELGKPQQALEDYRQALALTDDELAASIYNDQGFAHLVLRDPLAAINAYDAALALNSEFSAALSWRGYAHLVSGHYRAARADFAALLELTPQSGSAMYSNAIGQLHTGDLDAAQTSLEQSLSMDLTSTQVISANWWLAVLVEAQGRPTEAYLNAARAVTGNSQDAQLWLTFLMTLLNHDLAEMRVAAFDYVESTQVGWMLALHQVAALTRFYPERMPYIELHKWLQDKLILPNLASNVGY